MEERFFPSVSASDLLVGSWVMFHTGTQGHPADFFAVGQHAVKEKLTRRGDNSATAIGQSDTARGDIVRCRLLCHGQVGDFFFSSAAASSCSSSPVHAAAEQVDVVFVVVLVDAVKVIAAFSASQRGSAGGRDRLSAHHGV